MNIRIDWSATIAAITIGLTLLVFPFANSCEREDSQVCTWHADSQGNSLGSSFTDFYGWEIRR